MWIIEIMIMIWFLLFGQSLRRCNCLTALPMATTSPLISRLLGFPGPSLKKTKQQQHPSVNLQLLFPKVFDEIVSHVLYTYSINPFISIVVDLENVVGFAE
jgi:hypothetical protein